MRFATKVIVLIRDANGFGPSLADSLIPSPNSDLTKSESSSFEISLEKYEIIDQKASGDLIQFLDPEGSPQVSILLLPNYGPPLAACAVREVLSLIAAEESNQPTIILPFVMKALKFSRDMVNLASSEQEGTLGGAEMGAVTDFTRSMIAGTATIPPSLRMNCEPLACLLHMVCVLCLPTVLLIASASQSRNKKSADHELEALHKVGQFLADRLGLCFSKDRVQHKPFERSNCAQEPWRSLYG